MEPNPDHDYLTKPRLHEPSTWPLQLPQDDPDFLAGNPMLVPNQWPDWIPGFEEEVMAYYDAVTQVGNSLLPRLHGRPGLPEDFFANLTTGAAAAAPALLSAERPADGQRQPGHRRPL